MWLSNPIESIIALFYVLGRDKTLGTAILRSWRTISFVDFEFSIAAKNISIQSHAQSRGNLVFGPLHKRFRQEVVVTKYGCETH